MMGPSLLDHTPGAVVSAAVQSILLDGNQSGNTLELEDY